MQACAVSQADGMLSETPASPARGKVRNAALSAKERNTMKQIVIVGAGLAGYTAAREFRKLDKTTPLIIITADDGGFYSKPMLSNAFAQNKRAEQLVTQTAAQMAQQVSANIMTGTRVINIDAAAKTVDTTAGTYEYGKLIIAVGAQPIRLPIAGDAEDQILSVNHISDYAAFRTSVSRFGEGGVARVTILGAGLIGCEFADDLSGAGHAVTLIDPNPVPLSALAAPALSEGLREALVAKEVALQLGTTATAVNRAGDALRVTLANGTSFETDIVLSAVGLRPDLRLAQAANLSTGRGIMVDITGRTSAMDVYALGDCAEYTSEGGTRTLPYIAPLMTAARAIARTLTGEPTAIDLKAAPVIVKTPSYPLALVPPPLHAIAGGSWHAEQNGTRTICRFYDGAGVMCGFGVSPQEATIRAELLAALGSANSGAANIAA
ncbi:MAG: putative rubredoxin-NAD(+) reductase NorW-like [Burkholderia sp.]|nr:putative rubredoxin-NAD(+) reductase NorW-like [Burkholderia sp.]